MLLYFDLTNDRDVDILFDAYAAPEDIRRLAPRSLSRECTAHNRRIRRNALTRLQLGMESDLWGTFTPPGRIVAIGDNRVVVRRAA